MTSPALAKLLGPKPTEPQPIEWIKVRRHAPYVRLVVPACEVCGTAPARSPGITQARDAPSTVSEAVQAKEAEG